MSVTEVPENTENNVPLPVKPRRGRKPGPPKPLTPTQIKHRNAKARDAQFIEFMHRDSVQEEANKLKKSKRIGYMREAFQNETGLTLPLSMAYKTYHKAFPNKKSEHNGSDSDSSESPRTTTLQWASDDDNNNDCPERETIDEEPVEIV